MATIEKYQNASGATLYRVRYRTPGNRSTQKRGFTTKRGAEQFANSVEVKKMTGLYVSPTLGRVTVAELATGWLDRKKQAIAPSSWVVFEAAWRCHVAPAWGPAAVADINVLDVEAWIAGMSRAGAGATTVRRAVVVLSGILGDAVKSRRLATNPARGVENLPRRPAKRHVYLSADDVARLADECGDHRALVLLLAYCGLRWSEAIALRVADVEFLRRRISVSAAAVQMGSRHAVGPTKSRKTRTVPVPAFVLDELAAQCRGKAPGDLVFPGRGGGYLSRPKSQSAGWFGAAARRAGIAAAITPHDLRHTCASLAVSAGVNVLALQRMLGHASAKMTLDTYADLFDDDLDAVAVTLHARYSPGDSENVAKMWPRGTEPSG